MDSCSFEMPQNRFNGIVPYILSRFISHDGICYLESILDCTSSIHARCGKSYVDEFHLQSSVSTQVCIYSL